MNVRKALLVVCLVVMSLVSGCNFAGHGVDVTLPNNGCSVAACTGAGNPGNISIH